MLRHGIRTRIIRIGNSQGIRLPKRVLEQTGLEQEVEILVQNRSLLIRPAHERRAGWADAFREMSERGEDKLIDGEAPSLSAWDEAEWEW